jgi:hypothetical protein
MTSTDAALLRQPGDKPKKTKSDDFRNTLSWRLSFSGVRKIAIAISELNRDLWDLFLPAPPGAARSPRKVHHSLQSARTRRANDGPGSHDACRLGCVMANGPTPPQSSSHSRSKLWRLICTAQAEQSDKFGAATRRAGMTRPCTDKRAAMFPIGRS